MLTQLTGANGLPTDWVHDGFGRKVLEVRADGTSSTTAYRWSDYAARAWFVETESSGTAPALARYDRYGRLVRALAISGDGRLVQQDTGYDAFSRPNHRTNPSYNDGSPVYATTTAYDLLGRPTSTVTPDDQNGPQTTTYAYNGFSATATDPKGRVSATVRNSQGWTTSSIRNQSAGPGAADYSAVTSAYDALGNLTGTTAAGVVTALDYDLRGRKTAMTDPDMGAWSYRYNCFGELIWQKDAKGQVTTLAYDALGRLVSRSEPEGVTTWTYDTSPTRGLGKLHQVSAPGGYAETHLYDTFGRPVSVTRTIDGTSYALDTAYDDFGRPRKTEYPTVNGGRFATRAVYNQFGFLKEIRAYLAADDSRPNSQLQGRLYWQADTFNAAGRIDSELLGNGLVNDRLYSAATGRLLSAAVDAGRVTGPPYALQQMVYTYDQVGNVLTRADQAVGRGEAFAYDGLDRLLSHSVVTGSGGVVTVAYDQKGNITSKSDVGTYDYDPVKKHALVSVLAPGSSTPVSYSYDANGNMLSGGGRTLTWTSFNQAATITKGAFASAFSFDAAHQRVKHVSHLETTVYVGGVFEQVTPAGASPVVESKHYIFAPTGRVAVYTDRSNLQRDVKFFHTDGLGSITAVTDEKGAVVKRFAFDAWGKRLNPATGAALGGADVAGLRRGYTDHEQLDDLGLVHMNGRVYDPVLGRFLSADPFVDGVADAQGFNRYSYVGNNPMNATDPSGFFKLKDALKIVAIVAATIVTAGAALYAAAVWAGVNVGVAITTFGSALSALAGGGLSFAGAVVAGAGAGFGSGFAGSLLNGGSIGDAFKAGAIGAVVGGISAGIAHGIGTMASDLGWGWETQAAAHGVAQGGMSEAMGGEFRHGFYAGYFSSAFASSGSMNRVPGDVAGKTVASAIVGGTASAIGGGKFANGAMSGAFTYLFNHAAHPKRDPADQRTVVGKYIVGEDQQIEHVFDADRKRVLGVRKTFFEREIDAINKQLAVNGEKVELVWVNSREELRRELAASSNLKGGVITAFHGGRDGNLTVGREKVSDSWLIGEVGKISGTSPLMLYCQPRENIFQNAMTGFGFMRRELGLKQ